MPINFKLEKYRQNTNVFIETGSLRGYSINKALEAGYNKIYSIELDEKRYKWVKDEFEDDDEIEIIHGNSNTEFSELMDNIDEKCTIYLDAHYCGDNAEIGDKWSPIREELNCLKKHFIKDHVIIIGDWKCHNNTHVDEKTGLETGYMGEENTKKKNKKNL